LAHTADSARRQVFPPLTSVIMHASRRDTADLFRQGMWMTLDRNISGNLYPNIFYMLLGAYGSVESVGIFRLAIKFATLPSSLVMPSIARMSSTTIPKLVAKNIHTAVRESTKILFTTVTLITLVTIGSCLAMPFVIPLVYGQSFAAASTIFFFLSPINIITGSHVISVPFLRVLRRVWIITYVHLAGILLAIAAFFLLKDWIGAVSATIASILIFHLNSLWLFAYLYYKIGNPFTRAKRS
jgi:O-antigen/teichoic acid export membrane protein